MSILLLFAVSVSLVSSTPILDESLAVVYFPEINVSIPSEVVSEANEEVPDVPTDYKQLLKQFTNQASTSQVKFTLYTSKKEDGVSLNSKTSIQKTPFDSSKPTNILVHSYSPKANSAMEWTHEFKKDIFTTTKKGGANVIVVDWVEASTTNFYQAVANSHLVAKSLASLLHSLQESKGLTGDTVHMFGHGVGAHIAGMAASNFGNVAHITAFDPCGRHYSNASAAFRLDSTDADLVEVIHTDDSGMGTNERSGHVDIYFNGGVNQPGTITVDQALQTSKLFYGGDDVISDGHYRGIEYYRTGLVNQKIEYNIFQAEDYATFLLGTSFKIRERFGPNISKSARGSFFASSFKSAPYLSKDNNYWTVLLATENTPMIGKSSIVINDVPKTGDTTTIVLDTEDEPTEINQTGNLRSILVLPHGSSPSDFTYQFSYEIQGGTTGTSDKKSLDIVDVVFFKTDVEPTRSAGHCTALQVYEGSTSSSVSVSEDSICELSSRQTVIIVGPLHVGLIVAATAAAGIKGLLLVKGLVKILKVPLAPKIAKKVSKVLKAGIKVFKLLAAVKLKKLLKTKLLVKKITKLPLKFALLKIISATGSVGIKLAKIKDFLKDVTGLDKDNKNIVKKILSLLSAGDNDSLFEKVIQGIKGALKLNLG